jgi:inhibitor of cysteine peptidase
MLNGKRTMSILGAVALLALGLLSCGPAVQPTPTPGPGPGGVIKGEPVVESVDVQILESFPVQVHAVVRGSLGDGCTTLDEVTTSREGNLLRIRLTSQRPADAVCTLALVPFEEVVALDVVGLPAGQYTVDANGVTETFELAIDNVLPEATP